MPKARFRVGTGRFRVIWQSRCCWRWPVGGSDGLAVRAGAAPLVEIRSSLWLCGLP